jgi:lysozyme
MYRRGGEARDAARNRRQQQQRSIDWGAVAGAQYGFAVAKATEGVTFVDQTFASNWAGMQANGLVRGAYHFAHPDDNKAEDEAKFFLDTIQAQVGSLQPADFLALDLEIGAGDLGDWALDWLRTVKDRIGFRPLIYSSPSFLQAHGCTSVQELGNYGLWLADWQATLPSPPSPWSFVAIWQNTDSASVPGVSGNCDGDFFNGSRDRLVLYGKRS